MKNVKAVLNAQFAIDQQRDLSAFESTVQGTVRASTGYAGFDMSQGTPMAVLRKMLASLIISSLLRSLTMKYKSCRLVMRKKKRGLNAELSRMEGGMAAASARASGTASLISGLGDAAKTGYETGLIGGDNGTTNTKYTAQASVTREAPGRQIRARQSPSAMAQAELDKEKPMSAALKAAGAYAKTRYNIQTQNNC